MAKKEITREEVEFYYVKKENVSKLLLATIIMIVTVTLFIFNFAEITEQSSLNMIITVFIMLLGSMGSIGYFIAMINNAFGD